MGVPEADLLRVWYEDKGKDAQVQSISDQVGRGGGKTGDPRKELKDIDGERLGYGEKVRSRFAFSLSGVCFYFLIAAGLFHRPGNNH